MKVLGITGGTGCGKTTLLHAAGRLGAYCIDCDELYHSLLESDVSLRAALRERFPSAFSGGHFDRKALGRLVFHDPQLLRALNTLTHSHVCAAVDRLLTQARESGYTLAAIDAIALFESGLDRRCDLTVAVTAPEALSSTAAETSGSRPVNIPQTIAAAGSIIRIYFMSYQLLV